MYFIVQKGYFKNPHMLIVSKVSFFFLLLLFVEHVPKLLQLTPEACEVINTQDMKEIKILLI